MNDAANSFTTCRICNSPDVVAIGQYQPYLDFETTVYDCRDCGCRFAEHDESVYERLHASATSSYGWMEVLANRAVQAYRDRGAEGLRQCLSEVVKYRLVMNVVDLLHGPFNLAERGGLQGAREHLAGIASSGRRDVV
ncbi:MAG: hypothetical protein A2V70_11600 [Planctomycetes bacterium RBG_13_63_9]|nr:MAG: hypothetical protein A2V70_11600 [Planctomycetes bacterium RBG_13_63_9]